MNFKEWLDKLDERGSTDDPIFYKGEETTPNKLSWEFSPLDSIAGVRIEYWGGSGKRLRRINGTAGGMLRERSRGFKPERRRRCISWQ